MAYVTETVVAASASSVYSEQHAAINAFNTGTSLTGASGYNTWATDGVGAAWIKAQCGAGKVITRILYHNFFDIIGGSNLAGAKNFTFWGSNDDAAWTQLVCSRGSFEIHVNNDEPDPKYITVNNAASFVYHKFIIADNYGNGYTIGLRRIELQSGSDAPPPPPTYPPVVTTTAITGITASDADGGGNVTDAGGGTVSARGVCWNTGGSPTIADSKTTDGSGLGVFVSSLTPLTAPTTYYVRAWATNQYGTAYGMQVSFKTLAPPTVTTTSPATKIKNTQARVSAVIVATGDVDPTVRGVCYNTTGTPTTANSKVEENGTFSAGPFMETLTGLTKSTLYYARAYATNTEGTAYGAQITFTTLSVESITDPLPSLRDTFYLHRAGRYADPLNSNDRLPLVYGDLTDGVNGIWQLPCIDTVNNVYCFAGFPVLPCYELLTIDVAPAPAEWSAGATITGALSGKTCIVVAKLTGTTYTVRSRSGEFTSGEILSDGTNSRDCEILYPTFTQGTVTIYEDGQELDNSLYVFDESNDYEGEGEIATVNFTSPKDNAVITATGKGKVLTGQTLMENIVDIVNDFLTVENNFTSDLFEATKKARASQVFTAQGYAAAGVISEDGVYWDIIQRMMATFLGSTYLNGAGDLVLEIDDGTMELYGVPIIRKGETELIETKQRLVNLINKCPANYAYSYAAGEFKQQTNTIAHADAISQDIYGTREPNTPLQLYWCRNITDAQTIQDIIVEKFKDPVYEISLSHKSLKSFNIDVGDHFVYSVDILYDKDGNQMNNHYWRAVSVNPDPSRATIGFRAIQTPHFLTVAYLLDGSWILDGSVKFGGNRDTVVY